MTALRTALVVRRPGPSALLAPTPAGVIARWVAFGDAAPGAQSIAGAGFSDADAFGGGTVAARYALAGLGFADGDGFGAGALLVSQFLVGVGFSDEDSFGGGELFAPPPPPQNGPSGGLSWLRGRRAPFADEVLDLRPRPPQRRRDRSEILLLMP